MAHLAVFPTEVCEIYSVGRGAVRDMPAWRSPLRREFCSTGLCTAQIPNQMSEFRSADSTSAIKLMHGSAEDDDS